MAATKNDVIKTMDPRLDLTRGSKMVLEEGARLVGLVKRTSSRADNTGVTFDNIDPGSPGFVIDRKIYTRIGMQVDLRLRNGDGSRLVLNSATQAELTGGVETLVSGLGINETNGFRAFPIAQATRNLELLLNGESFNERLNDYVEPLMRYDNDYIRAKTDYSMSPSLQDRAIDGRVYYGESGLNNGGGAGVVLDNTLVNNLVPFTASIVANPYSDYGSTQNINPRGSYLDKRVPTERAIITGTLEAGNKFGGSYDYGGFIVNFAPVAGVANDTSQIESITLKHNQSTRILLTEPIMLPITCFGEPDCRGFYGVNDMSVNMVFDGKLSDKIYEGVPLVFTYPDVGAGNPGFLGDVTDLQLNPDVTIQTADLYYNRLTPKITPELPLSNIYDDKRVKITDKEFTVAYGVNETSKSGSFSFNNISVGTIPKRIYIFITKANKTFRDTDVYGTITSLSFEFNNQNTQFSGADSEQLYLMSKRNGLFMEYKEWETKVGSVLCIDFAKDVSLNDGDYPGRIGNYNFSFTIGYTVRRFYTSIADFVQPINPAGASLDSKEIAYKVRTVVLEEGYAIVQNQICSRVGGLIQIDPTSVPLRVMSKDQYWENIYGGKFVDDLKHIAHKGLQYAEKALPYVEKGAKAAIKYAPEVAKGIASLLPMLAAGAGMSEKEAQRLIDTYGVDEFMSMYGSGVKSGKMSLQKKARGGKMTSKSEMMKYM